MPTTECVVCHDSAKYNTELSHTFKNISNSVTSAHYGTGNIWGFKSQDQVCLNMTDPSSCLGNLDMIAVTKTTNLDGILADGIVGLSPNVGQMPNSLISLLFSQGLIA